MNTCGVYVDIIFKCIKGTLDLRILHATTVKEHSYDLTTASPTGKLHAWLYTAVHYTRSKHTIVI